MKKLSKRIEDIMPAFTLAEAGEFVTAKEILTKIKYLHRHQTLTQKKN